MDIMQSRMFKVTPKHPKWNVDKFNGGHADLDKLSLDLSEYGIPKPGKPVFEENLSGNLLVLDWEDNNSCVRLIRERRVDYICDEVMQFAAPNNIELKSGKVLEDYDAVILCTGYKHGLEEIFVKELFDKYFEKSEQGERWGIIPKTNGYNQCSEDNKLFFLGLLGDFSVIGGFANGHWGWEVARNIAEQKDVYSYFKEPWKWNKYTVKRMGLVIFTIGSLCTAVYLGYKGYNK